MLSGELQPPRGWTAPRGNWAYRVSRGIVRSLLTGFIQRQLHGFENVAALARPRQGFILASSHISHFDGPILAITAPGAIDWLIAAEFLKVHGLGTWLRKSGAVSVGRDVLSLDAAREARRRLRGGRALGIFPEGGIRSGGTSVLNGAPLLRGTGWLARQAGVPVVPCVVLGTDRLYVARRWLPWRKRVPVWIGFGPAIRPEEWADESPGLLGERLRALCAEMRETFRLQPDDLPMTFQQRNRHKER